MKVVLHPDAPLKNPDWQPVAPDRVMSGAPLQAFEVCYTSPSGEFTSGIYQSTAGAWRVAYTEDEFCTLIEGHVRLTDAASNKTDEFHAPASFVIPAGFTGTWESVTDVRKHFVIYEKKT